MTQQITIFSSATCAPCQKLKAKLETAGLLDAVQVKDIGTLDNRNECVKRGVRAVPAIFLGDDLISEDKLFEVLH